MVLGCGMLLAQRIIPPAPWTVTVADPQGAIWTLDPGTSVSTGSGAWTITGGASAILVVPVLPYWAYTMAVTGFSVPGTAHSVELSSGGSGGAMVSSNTATVVALITRDAINTTGNIGAATSLGVQISIAGQPLNFTVTSITVTASETV